MPDTDPDPHADPAIGPDLAPPGPPPPPDPLKAVRALAAQQFFTIGALIAVTSALMATVLPRELESSRRALLVALFLAYGGLSLLAGLGLNLARRNR